MSASFNDKPRPKHRGVRIGALSIALLSVAATVYFWHQGETLAFLAGATVVISIVIWQACDPLAEAAHWVGRVFHLPGSVRGATLDAVASSMPELCSGIFFVVVAVTALGGDPIDEANAWGEGYGSAVATCAGSAIYNMIVIPAVCALVISFARRSRPTIDVERAVLSRDGVFYLVCVALLLGFLWHNRLTWWMAVALLGLYGVYVVTLLWDARGYRRVFRQTRDLLGEMGLQSDPHDVAAALADAGVRAKAKTVARIQNALRHGQVDPNGDGEEDDDRAGLFFGLWSVPLSGKTVWWVIAGATAAAAVACYFLVAVVLETARTLEVPSFFVAVILAAAASSVPDTLLSIGAARRGDDSGAISNAFGSNIFDICVCLSIPLLMCCYLNGWQPIELLKDGEPMVGLVGLQTLLWVLTLVTLLIIWHNHQVTRAKALLLCCLYSLFVAYAVLGSMGYDPLKYLL
ncbi:MAG: sodium:calcium antiporter [Planctomycetota bacterium]|jgi:cation:H+ antiporter